jgi:hypothetical protein
MDRHVESLFYLYLAAFFATLPLMVIVAFVAHTIGRRKFTLIGLLLLTTVFAVTLWLALWIPWHMLKYLYAG